MDLQNVRCVLLDVEGTTTSINFVKYTLMPYVARNVEKYLRDTWDHPDTKSVVEGLIKTAEQDVAIGTTGVIPIPKLSTSPTKEEISEVQEALAQNVLWQMSFDRKTTPLKQLQGDMWAAAYNTKQIMGDVYDDVPTALYSWRRKNIKVYIYSSGSIEAQKFLFANTKHGDLLGLINGHFDSNIGPKTESSSYRNILKEINLDASSVLFLTDSPHEAYAAREAGMRVALVVRPGNPQLTVEHRRTFYCVYCFMDLDKQLEYQ